MRRAIEANVDCVICGMPGVGVAIAAVSPGDGDAPELVEICLGCVDEMFDTAKVLQRRMRPASTRHADYGPDWDRVRTSIGERDGWLCQDEEHAKVGGNDRGEKLLVHHIRPLRTFNGNYLAANQPDNLITLCEKCHGKWHGAIRKAENAMRKEIEA